MSGPADVFNQLLEGVANGYIVGFGTVYIVRAWRDRKARRRLGNEVERAAFWRHIAKLADDLDQADQGADLMPPRGAWAAASPAAWPDDPRNRCRRSAGGRRDCECDRDANGWRCPFDAAG